MKETVREITLFVLCCFAGIYLPVSLYFFTPLDFKNLVYPPAETPQHPMGQVGSHLAYGALKLLGKSSYVLSGLVAAWSAVRFIRRELPGLAYKATGCLVCVLSLATLEAQAGRALSGSQGGFSWWLLKCVENPVPPFHGGVIGTWFAVRLSDLFGVAAVPATILVAILATALATDFLFYPYVLRLMDLGRRGAWRLPKIQEGSSNAPSPPLEPHFTRPAPAARQAQPQDAPQATAPPPSHPLVPPVPSPSPETRKSVPKQAGLPDRQAGDDAKPESEPKGYLLPPADLLDEPQIQQPQLAEQLVEERSTVLMRTLQQFGIEAAVVQVDRGPVVTMYELMPAPGVKVHRIMALENDLAMALKATAIRIVAPIPGKATVGVEVPNLTRGIVRLRELLPQSGRDLALPLLLGRDTVGEPLVADLSKMPHLLIAGATGSGKTVCLSALILSLLVTRKPTEVKLILIDPKMVELTGYRDIPHLACPVVTDTKRAVSALAWAVQEMDGRYDLLARAGVRNIEGYNKLQPEELAGRLAADDPQAIYPERLPYLVVVVDELADLMMVCANEIEASVIRLAQKSRSVGLHLILATQRPSVDVLTGLIKSNLPARISFQVASKVDSRTILDRNGADKLLGAGDLLFLAPGALKMTRGQGTFISEEEVRRVVEFVKRQASPQYEPDLVRIQELSGEVAGNADELYEEAVRFVLENQRGSVSLIQRRFGIGYTRAARLIDTMAQEGLVGQYKGSQAREVLVSLADWEKMRASRAGPTQEQVLEP